MKKKFPFKRNVNPDNEPKDPSDFCKKYSLNSFKNLIKDLLIL